MYIVSLFDILLAEIDRKININVIKTHIFLFWALITPFGVSLTQYFLDIMYAALF